MQDSDERLVEVFRALGHPARLRIVRLLMQRRTCICSEMVDDLHLAQATVPQHLKVLKEAGIIVGRVERHGGLLLPGAGGSCRGARRGRRLRGRWRAEVSVSTAGKSRGGNTMGPRVRS